MHRAVEVTAVDRALGETHGARTATEAIALFGAFDHAVAAFAAGDIRKIRAAEREQRARHNAGKKPKKRLQNGLSRSLGMRAAPAPFFFGLCAEGGRSCAGVSMDGDGAASPGAAEAEAGGALDLSGAGLDDGASCAADSAAPESARGPFMTRETQ